ncbi:MAG: hypothetical protein AVDCRST_MAG96-3161, partial [uncultured Segetibacter sp.]
TINDSMTNEPNNENATFNDPMA